MNATDFVLLLLIFALALGVWGLCGRVEKLERDEARNRGAGDGKHG